MIIVRVNSREQSDFSHINALSSHTHIFFMTQQKTHSQTLETVPEIREKEESPLTVDKTGKLRRANKNKLSNQTRLACLLVTYLVCSPEELDSSSWSSSSSMSTSKPLATLSSTSLMSAIP